MMSFLQDNYLNIIIVAVLVVIVGLIIKSLIKQKKNGGACTGNCASCHSSCGSKSNLVKTTLKIDGMMCTMCESHINEAIRQSFKVKKVKSSHTNGTTIIISKHRLDENLLKETIAKTGYELKEINFELT